MLILPCHTPAGRRGQPTTSMFRMLAPGREILFATLESCTHVPCCQCATFSHRHVPCALPRRTLKDLYMNGQLLWGAFSQCTCLPHPNLEITRPARHSPFCCRASCCFVSAQVWMQTGPAPCSPRACRAPHMPNAGTLPEAWGSSSAFPSLTALALQDNQLSGAIPASWQAAGAFPQLLEM